MNTIFLVIFKFTLKMFYINVQTLIIKNIKENTYNIEKLTYIRIHDIYV